MPAASADSRRTIASRTTLAPTDRIGSGGKRRGRRPTIGRSRTRSSRALEGERGEDPAAQVSRRDPVAAVAVTEVDPTAGQRPVERAVVVADVDRAAPGVLDPDIVQAREDRPEARRGAACRAGVGGERVADPTGPARPTAAAAEGDPAVAGGPQVVEREPRVAEPLATGPAELGETVGDRLGEDDVARPGEQATARTTARPPAHALRPRTTCSARTSPGTPPASVRTMTGPGSSGRVGTTLKHRTTTSPTAGRSPSRRPSISTTRVPSWMTTPRSSRTRRRPAGQEGRLDRGPAAQEHPAAKDRAGATGLDLGRAQRQVLLPHPESGTSRASRRTPRPGPVPRSRPGTRPSDTRRRRRGSRSRHRPRRRPPAIARAIASPRSTPKSATSGGQLVPPAGDEAAVPTARDRHRRSPAQGGPPGRPGRARSGSTPSTDRCSHRRRPARRPSSRRRAGRPAHPDRRPAPRAATSSAGGPAGRRRVGRPRPGHSAGPRVAAASGATGGSPGPRPPGGGRPDGAPGTARRSRRRAGRRSRGGPGPARSARRSGRGRGRRSPGSATAPVPLAAAIAEPSIAVSTTRGTATVKPVMSALSRSSPRSRASPPETRSSRTGRPASTIGAATWRRARFAASRTARTRWARPWRRVSPTNAPRASPGPRSATARRPGTAGRRARRPSGRSPVASAMSPGVAAGPRPRTDSRSQSSALPVAFIAPPRNQRPGIGAAAPKTPGMTTGRSV